MEHTAGSESPINPSRSETPDQPVFNEPLLPPAAPFLAPSEGSPTPRDSYLTTNSVTPSATPSAALLPDDGEKDLPDQGDSTAANRSQPLHKRPLIWALAVAAVALIAVAVIVPVYFVVIKPKNNNVTGGNSNGTNGNGNPNSPTHQPPSNGITGGNGSTIITADGTQFTYINPFGGIWVSDPNDPFNNDAYCNSWTPPLNTSWVWGQDKLYGVNLGGWFVLEPFITPTLFQKYQPDAVDEWTISIAMAADTASGGISQLENHYKTFITEQDFAEIAGAGLNWVRIPIPFWAIEVWGNEPFLARTSWQYILTSLEWARKYGLRVKIDLHTIPGSQNGYNHSGKLGDPNFLNGVMGIANAQRALSYIRVFGEFFAQQEYSNLVGIFGIMNEPAQPLFGKDALVAFYIQAHNVLREITGIGKGYYISIGNGFAAINSWDGFLPNSDRIILDSHPYFAFNGEANDSPISTTGPDGNYGGVWPQQACSSWANQMVSSQSAFGVSIAGEYSNGFNDCGFWLRGTTQPTPMNPDCSLWNDYASWNDTVKQGLKNYALASMDALVYPFFWTWKIGPTASGDIEAPLWSYQLGLQGGWMPTDPRDSVGKCKSLGVDNSGFNGQYLNYATGTGGDLIPSSVIAASPFPPLTISNAPSPVYALPFYTPTGTVVTLPPPTNTGKDSSLNGWADNQDTAPAPTPISGCNYPNAYTTNGVVPLSGCSTAGGGVPPTNLPVATSLTSTLTTTTTTPAVVLPTTTTTVPP
ncbi:glycoside hydrolase family 5 protein [Thelephora terrestris]|uniref:glucan 1,3-beta-glucosidase n=1 Tax=Thelephora terrestris TaxID=56493 RepID=A0A9P6HEZ0_9AGAM|nr:glycoside hydrolase family 5 protein [Thelephora terrestris]